jgi:hypothetical protein
VFQSAHRELKPSAPLPVVHTEFFPFAGLNHTVRLRDNRLLVRISDLCTDAPDGVLHSLALMLLGKLYGLSVDAAHRHRYRRFILGREIQERAMAARANRGRRPRVAKIPGRHRNLESAFDRLNAEYFAGRLERPGLSWTVKRARHILGRYDATHRAIVISRIFDSPAVPDFVVDFVLFHEMLHMKHQVQSDGCRLVIHSAEMRAEERSFRHYAAARDWLRRL